MAANQPNALDLTAKKLAATEGIDFFAIIDNQGVPIRTGGRKEADYTDEMVVQYAALSTQHLKLVRQKIGTVQGMPSPHVENVRLKTALKEIIIVPGEKFFTLAIQSEEQEASSSA